MTDESFDNETLWKLYSPKPNPWFSSEITYQGWGIATFDKPAGTVEGPTKIVVNETGRLKIEMEYENLHTDVTIYGTGHFKFVKFVQGNIGSKETENMIAIGSGNSNPCSKLTVQTETGTFTSSSKVFCSEQLGLDNKFRFYISEGMFKVNSAGTAKYWVVPLTNFISNFHLETHPLLTQHLLRLYSTPLVPEIEGEKQMKTALFIANRANLLISFYINEKLGYIQPILDYSEKKAKLESGELNQCITALMVGEINNDFDDPDFPNNYVNLLSLASGAEVEGSWVEFRDSDGNLVTIKHIHSKSSTYRKEYAVLDEELHGGTGHLLTVASKSPEFRKDYCQVLINHLIRLSPLSYHIEDQMALIGRGLDALCKELGIGSRKLGPTLPNIYLDQVNSILDEAAGKLKQLSRLAKKENLTDESNILIRLSDKVVQTASNKDGDFGLKVLELLKRFNFVDAVIMEAYHSSGPEPKMSWGQTVSQYRNTVIHEGYFHIRDGTHDFQKILAIENHLHDLMVRIILKILEYQGQYQPRMANYLVDGKTVDWVSNQTTATELGYGEEP